MAKKFGWKQNKTIGMYLNRKQHQREFDPTQTAATEITTENGMYLATEALIDANDNSLNYYIIAE
tara:strand:- start:604 stop:798 length:195 start_codon:yes stop_codon:yes gene_type:complete